MKKAFCLLLALMLGLSGATALADGLEGALFAQDSATLSPALLQAALDYCCVMAQDGESVAATLSEAGFEVLRQSGYDKAPDDAAHSCAYTIARQPATVRGETRDVLLVTIRGTASAGEWMSNFDFAPSHSNETAVAENFFFAAEAVYDDLKAELAGETCPAVLVTGYSRGAAVANLLGVLLDIVYGPEDIYVYTFATPTTMRGERALDAYPNIFNVVNPADLVTRMPLEAWGYRRPGTDIVLPASAQDVQVAQAGADTLAALSPDISSYYTDKHSLTEPGLSEQGMTAYQFMQGLSASMMPSAAQTPAPEMQAQGMQQMQAMMESGNDFVAVMQLFAATAGGEQGQRTVPAWMAQHMPDTYRALLAQMDWETP